MLHGQFGRVDITFCMEWQYFFRYFRAESPILNVFLFHDLNNSTKFDWWKKKIYHNFNFITINKGKLNLHDDPGPGLHDLGHHTTI